MRGLARGDAGCECTHLRGLLKYVFGLSQPP